ncbi:MAG: transposase [Lentisphaerae bacterium]|nr:transposase [Lentisphaerota bacterium]
MARHLRVEFEGAIYHVTCRMIGDRRLDQSRLFVDDKDRERFLDCLAARVKQYHIRLYLFVCMTNHFHLVFETPGGNCSKFMQSLSTAYTVYYNLRHRRHGHLLDGRYKAKLVEGDEYLLALSRYVHLNPVRVGGIKDKPIAEQREYLLQYPWGTYLGYIGRRKTLDFVEYAPILSEISGKRRGRPGRYQEFVEEGLVEEDHDLMGVLKASPRSIGDDGFRAWIDELYQELIERHRHPEDAAFRRITEPLSADAVLSVLAEVFDVSVEDFRRRRRDSALRGIAGRFLVRYAGMTQREVAVELGGVGGGAVSRQMRKVGEWLKEASESHLRRKVERAEERMAQLRQSMRRPTGARSPAGAKC